MKLISRLLAALALTPVLAPAQTLDFETVPGGAPADKLPITDQYRAAYGVVFRLSNGSAPVLEQAGGSDSGYGFLNEELGPDVAAPGYEAQLGRYFLRIGTGDSQSAPLPDLLVHYDTPVAAASAQIWDIDGKGPGLTEQWRVDALNASGQVIDTLTSPVGTSEDAGSLNGKPWNWSFNHGALADIAGVRVAFIGSKLAAVGMGFDNFSVSSPVPEPGSLTLLLVGVAALAGAYAPRPSAARRAAGGTRG